MANIPTQQSEPLVKEPLDLVNAIEQLLAAPYGMQGATIITATGAAHSVTGYCMVAIQDGTQLDMSNCDTNWREISAGAAGTPVTDLLLPVGVPFYGDFTKIFLLAGKVIVYNK